MCENCIYSDVCQFYREESSSCILMLENFPRLQQDNVESEEIRTVILNYLKEEN